MKSTLLKISLIFLPLLILSCGSDNSNSNIESKSEPLNVTLNKPVYLENELIYVNYQNLEGTQSDWIGLFAMDSETLIDSKQTEGSISGELSLAGLDVLADSENLSGGLKAGSYEVRVFSGDSSNPKTVTAFDVLEQNVISTIYESANSTISNNWVHVSGPTAPYYNEGMVSLETNWIDNFTNTSEYRLLFSNANTSQKVLELDAGGLRYHKHFYIGVILETTLGSRKMIWDPFFNHGNVSAFKIGEYLSYPLYVDIQLESEQKHHVRLDVEKYLRVLEPDNKVVSISAFMASGGDLDEIKLSSH